jgi:hypothetical protein
VHSRTAGEREREREEREREERERERARERERESERQRESERAREREGWIRLVQKRRYVRVLMFMKRCYISLSRSIYISIDIYP